MPNTTLKEDRKISWLTKINPIYWFLNDDDQWPESWYNPDSAFRVITWYFRNPVHNLFFYVIGIADKKKEFIIEGRFPGQVFAPDPNKWNWTIIKYKWMRFPFISYIGWCKFYAGWRERGNLGFKLTSNKK